MKSKNKIEADVNLFIDIHRNKYLKSVGKTEFSNIKEAKLVTDKITSVYNKEIASDHLRLDNLNADAKRQWYRSIEINYSDLNLSENDSFDDPEFPAEAFDKVSAHYDELFYFLPEGGWKLLLFAGPAFETYGFPQKRFKQIFAGKELTDFEVDLFNWAYDFVISIMAILSEKSNKKKKKLIEEAVIIGLDFLSEDDVRKVIPIISQQLLDITKDDFWKE